MKFQLALRVFNLRESWRGFEAIYWKVAQFCKQKVNEDSVRMITLYDFIVEKKGHLSGTPESIARQYDAEKLAEIEWWNNSLD